MNIIRQSIHLLSRAISFVLCLPIVFYQTCISPFTPASCRFTPTCSEYAKQALRKDSLLRY